MLRRSLHLFACLSAPFAAVLAAQGHVVVEEATLLPPDPQENLNYGLSLDLSGETLVSGTDTYDFFGHSSAGAVVVHERTGSGWGDGVLLTASDADDGTRLGDSVAIDGDTIVAGASWADVGGIQNAGAAYVFVRQGGA